MRLLSFYVENVRGFLTKEIFFRDKVTFLIGINGSGKTSVLNLLLGLLTPNMRTLMKIQYDKICLTCKHDNETIEISSKKDNNTITINYKDNEKQYHHVYSIESLFRIEKFSDIDIVSDEDFRRFDNIFQNSEIYKCIKNISTPVVVGLNRMMTNISVRNVIYDSFSIHNFSKEDYEDHIRKALAIVQSLIYSNIRQTARRQSRLADDFKMKVYEEMLTPTEILNWKHDYKEELKLLHKLKDDLRTSVNDDAFNKITERVNDYICKYEEAIDAYNNYSSKDLDDDEKRELFMNMLTRLLSYSFQYDKIVKVAEYAKENMNKISKLRQPIDRFVKSVNMFFKECKKHIVVSGNGDIIVINERNGQQKRDTIFNLSSGEKHIIILMAYLSFKIDNKSSHIYIVDEPELSLHITWQEQFVDALLEASPETQIILATHSPSIIARADRRSWCEDLTLA